MTDEVQIGIGFSTLADSAAAGREAVQRARDTVSEPQLALVFGSIRHDQEALLAGIAGEVDPRVVLGGSSYAEVATPGATMGGVAVALLSLPGARVRLAHEALGADEDVTGVKLARLLRDGGGTAGGSWPVGLLVRDLGDGTGRNLLRGLTRELGTVPFFGGLACGDYDLGMGHPDFFKNYQYVGGKPQRGSAGVALLDLPSDRYRPAFGFAHGWVEVAAPVRITRAVGGRVYAIDGVPVFDYYRQFLGQRESERFFESFIQRYGFSMPVTCGGMTRTVVKVPVACDVEDGSILFLPEDDLEGRMVQLIQASRLGVIEGARQAATRCREALDGLEPAVVLVVSCCTRRAILHSQLDSEVGVIRETFGPDVPLFGFYSGGELAPYASRYEDAVRDPAEHGVSHYHATTVALMALGTRDIGRRIAFPRELPRRTEPAEEIRHLRKLLRESEEILDGTEAFLTRLSRISYENGELLKAQNQLLAQKNEHNEKLQSVIHRYTPHDIWDQVGASLARGEYELPESDAHRTFMFMDVKGFTSYSERNPSEEVVRALNEIFHPATEIIYGQGGDIDKFIGDCIFAVFQTPEHAVQAGRKILVLFDELSSRGNPFSLRIGIHCGRAVRANVGSPRRREYTYIGDAVNLAQRLESNATPGRILVSDEVRSRSTMPFRELQRLEIRVKGKELPVVAWECTL